MMLETVRHPTKQWHLPPATVCRQAATNQAALFEDLSPTEQAALLRYVFTDDSPVDWSEEDVVFLHWRLLQELNDLSDPATPLEEKLDILRWVFTEPDKDGQPFSFANCLLVAGCSPLAPNPYFGAVDVDEIRAWIQCHLRGWFEVSLARYPDWVRQAVLQHPAWIESRLAKNPQWLNEEIKRRTVQADFFA